ncbi:hypothetical protein [Flavobacterium sp. RS13.1]|uniref:hypothetical protein n=1 Tax=Flavobacterium sp. RS13.1 TaxID=3400345 RepID=UPI003AABD109
MIKSLGKDAGYYANSIKQIKLVSRGQKLQFTQHNNGLEVRFPNQKLEASFANALEIV